MKTVRHALPDLSGRVAVVTGAASGIGLATARLLKRRGARLALCDIDSARLDAAVRELGAAGVPAFSRRTDVARPAEVEALASAVVSAVGTPELLVNSAGIAVVGSFMTTTADDWQQVIDVNLLGTVNICRAFLPSMIAGRRGGYIVNIASAAGFATQSELAAYGATKHALLGLSQALADELDEHGIGVAAVCPGFVDTPILDRARVRGSDPAATREGARRLLRARRLTAERVAERIVRAVERGSTSVPVGIEAQALWYLSRIAPSRVPSVFRMLRRLGSRT